MAKQTKPVKRAKYKNYSNIYLNESTGKFDVKYNYKEYSPTKKGNVYKAKWVYNCATITEARAALASLQANGVKKEDKDITLAGALELWKAKAIVQEFSEVTIYSTEKQLETIYKYLPADTKLKDITEEVYYNLFIALKKDYKDETVRTLNSAFRKLIKLSYKKELLADNFLYKADNIKTKQKDDYILISHEDFCKLDNYFATKKSNHGGYNAFPRLRFFYATLYYTGIRLSEALALTWQDFEEFDYYPKDADKLIRLSGTQATEHEHLEGMRILITKSLGRAKDESGIPIIKSPKNKKNRTIPIPPNLERLYWIEYNKHKANGGLDNDRIFTYAHSYALRRLKDTCKLLNINSAYNCHTFRHTYISNLIKQNVPIPVIEKVSGDTQETIFKRYSHMFEQDEVLVLKALDKL